MIGFIANNPHKADENTLKLKGMIESGENVLIELGIGTYYFAPERYFLSRNQKVIMTGCGSGLTAVKRQGQRIDNDLGCVFRITGGTNSTFSMTSMTWDGSADTHPQEPGDDQHHHVRIDGNNRMQEVSFYDILTENLISDGVQIAATDLALFSVRDWRTGVNLGRVRRDVQFSYHPENAIISDSVFNDFSSEPAGGTVHACNLQMSNCRVNRNLNLQRHRELNLVNVSVTSLSSFSCEDGFVTNCNFKKMGQIVFYGPCKATFSNTKFGIEERHLVFYPRYSSHNQNIKFNGCDFSGGLLNYAILLYTPNSQQVPQATYEFAECRFPYVSKAVFQVQRGSWLTVKNSEFLGGKAGFEFNNRFGAYSKITEHDNTYHTQLVGYVNKASSSEEVVDIESSNVDYIQNPFPSVFRVKPYKQIGQIEEQQIEE